jgi:signal transduction histidine kinase
MTWENPFRTRRGVGLAPPRGRGSRAVCARGPVGHTVLVMRPHLLSPLRGLMLFGLGLLGPVHSVGAVVISSTGFVRIYQLTRWLPGLRRRLAERWSSVSIPPPYLPEPPAPVPEPDGWYREGDQLYRSPKSIIRLRRWNWIHRDPATYRDTIWMLLEPVIGGPLALAPAALVLGGPALLLTGSWWAVPVAPLLVTLGFLTAPALLRLHARWARLLLAPPARSGRHPLWTWLVSRGKAAGRLGETLGLSLAGFGLGALHVLSIYPTFLSTWPYVVLFGRPMTNFRRRRIMTLTGLEILEPYLPRPTVPAPRPDGRYRVGRTLHTSREAAARAQHLGWTLKDPASWRDLAWLLADPIVTVLLFAVPLVLVFGVFFGLLWSWLWSLLIWPFVAIDPWWGLRPLVDLLPTAEPLPAWVGGPIGIAATLLGLAISPPLLRLHARWSALLLRPTRSAMLAQRVERLTETRTEATDARTADLRRIERDLHDGAQARLVAMGMHLSTIEQLIDRDPLAAKELVAKARDNSAQALAELREVVRGIHPPVLAERGLVDAVRAVALDSPLHVEVHAELSGSADDSVEAAAYFTVCELLTNAAKHAGAKRVTIALRHTGERLRITVTDDGRGGADPSAGSGLRGIERRLATFDGTLAISSPRGGPTTVTMEIPCALSSRRTSTSSETA